MNDWTAGYVADLGYTFGYYPELNPLRIRMAMLRAGLVPPEVHAACELGYGQGISANMHAAATPVQWFGTDFSPAQAAFAQELAHDCGSGAQLSDEGFADFCHRGDLPDFDFIALHGIWSWINDENRHHIVDFVRRKLRPGGVLYVSYNTLPGWATFQPMRHLLSRHAQVMGAEGRGTVGRVEDALAFADRLLAVKPGYAEVNPQVAGRLQDLAKRDRHYLAHEYFNRDWHPMHFGTMHEWLAPARLSHACSAHYLDHVDDLHLTAEQIAFLKELPDAGLRESVRDFMVNQFFRRDFWVKGPRRSNVLAQGEALRHQSVLLAGHRPDVSLKVTGTLGEAALTESLYAPILDLLADHRPRTLGDIEAAAAGSLPFGKLVQAIVLLTGMGYVMPAQDAATAASRRACTQRLNQALLQRARANGDIQHLASPVTGGGVPVTHVAKLALVARAQGLTEPSDWARHAWQLMSALKHRVKKDGRTLQTAEENLAELERQARAFAEKELPILQQLQVV